MNIRKIILCGMLFSIFSIGLEAKTIIWDLGGVLFAPNKFKIILNELGLGTLAGYTFLDHKNPRKLQEKAFAALNHLGTQTGPQELRLKSPDGLELPQLFVDVLLGAITHKEALQQSTDLINQLYKDKVIKCKREKNLLLRIMRTMFDSQTFVKYMNVIPAGADLVATCASDPECKQYVLSNWDADSFALLYESAEGQKVFKHITPENIVISGGCKLAKPDPAVFRYLIDIHNLDPKECVFIDDTLENVNAAQRCGLNTIYFHNMSYSDLQKILIKHGFLTSGSKGSTKSKGYATV